MAAQEIPAGTVFGHWLVDGPAAVVGAPPGDDVVAVAATWARTMFPTDGGTPTVPGTLVACPRAAALRGVLLDQERELRFAGLPDLRHPALPRLISSQQQGDLVIDVWDQPVARPWDAQRVGPAIALKRVESLCDALAVMHAHGVVHGALSPAALGEPPAGGLALVPHLAWRPRGLAAGASIDDAFAAPELCRPGGCAADPAADVWSMGILLATWCGATAPRVRNADADPLLPERPRTRAIWHPRLIADLDDAGRYAWLMEQEPGGLPGFLRPLLIAALRNDPAQRPRDGAALLALIRALLIEQGLSPQPAVPADAWRPPSGPPPGCLVPWPTLRSTMMSAAAAPHSLSGRPTTVPPAPAPIADDTLWVASGGLLSHESNRLLLAMVQRRLLPFVERYRVAAELGGGGMGTITRADDLLLERAVVMKRLHQHQSGNDMLAEQFLKEVRVMARFDHPNLIRVFDLGIDDAARLYYTMPFIDGAHLGDTLRRVEAASATTLVDYPFRNLARLVAQIADGLDSAHAVGVLHCDLKPHNVMVGGNGEVVIIDWGLAVLESSPEVQARFASLYRAEIGDGDGAGQATVAIGLPDRQVTGTPTYMAPEQARGSGVDRRTDVYGLGGILYACLCGKAPNEGASLMDILKRLTDGDAVNLPGQRLGERHRIVPPRLEAIAMRCLAHDPAQRYPSAGAVRNDLRRWLRETATEAAADD